jgi:hypothetical protein
MGDRQIYIIRKRPSTLKIGIADNPRHRLSGIQCSSHAPLFLDYAATVNGDARKLEAAVHEALRGCRQRGEWFKTKRSHAVAAIQTAAEVLGYTLSVEPRKQISLPFLQRFRDRHGKPRCYVRYAKKRITIPVLEGMPGFMAAYNNALIKLGLVLPYRWADRTRSNSVLEVGRNLNH